MTEPSSLETQSRPKLVEMARDLGVERPERMTRVELRSEIHRRRSADEDQLDARGLFGVARSMLAGVVEAGLKMPDAAKVIRGDSSIEVPARNQSPVATVTLAEIYAAQGHKNRAISMLREVLADEPDHDEAKRVLDELGQQGGKEPKGATSEARPADSNAFGVSESSSVTKTETEELQQGPATEYTPSVETTGEDMAAATPSHGTPAIDPPESSPSTPTESGSSVGIPAEDPAEEPWGSRGALAEESVEESGDCGGEPTEISEEESLGSRGASAEESVEESGDCGGEPTEISEESRLVSSVLSVERDDELPDSSNQRRGDLEAAPSQEVLVMDRRRSTLSLYFELPAEVLDRCKGERAAGRAVVQVVAFSPAGEHPIRRERTLELGDKQKGVLRVDGFAESDAVRAALGWLTEDGFRPLAVARSLDELGAPAVGTIAERAERELVLRPHKSGR